MSRILYVYDGKMTQVGIDAVVQRQLEALLAAGFAVDLVARGSSGLPEVRETLLRHSWANLISWLPRPYYYGAQRRLITRRARRLLTGNTYSAVIAWPQRALGVFRDAAGKVPCILNCDTLHFRARRGKNRTSRWPEILAEEMDAEYADASLILAPSDYSRQTFLDFGLPADKLLVLGRGIDARRFSPPTEPEPGRPFRLAFCGRVTERKGIRQILEAWQLAALENAELQIIGEIADDARRLVAANTDPAIRFLGFQADPAAFLRQCDAQILLSRTEGMAKSLLEGAACGLATLTTHESGFPMQDGVQGFFVERKKPGIVAEKLRQLHDHRDLCHELGAAGRAMILENYTTEKFSERFIAAVRSVCLP